MSVEVRMEGGWVFRSEDYCTVAEACRIAGVSKGYMCSLIRDKKVAGEKFGNTYVVLLSSLNDFQRRPGMGRPQVNGSHEQKPFCEVKICQAGKKWLVDRPFSEGLAVDFGEYWAHVERVFSGAAIGVSLNRSGCGVMNHNECSRLGWFLIGAAEWLRSQPEPDGFPDGCVVYAIGDGHTHHKIGKAVNIRKRLKQLQTGNGRKLRLVAYLPCENESQAYLAESAAQKSIEDCRSVGEWFECDSHTAIHALHEAQQLVGIVDPPVEMQPDDGCVPEMPGGPTDGR